MARRPRPARCSPAGAPPALVAGLAYGAREWPSHAARRLIALGVLLAAGAAAPLLAGSLPAMVVCLAVAGAAFAPWIATCSVVVDRVAVPGAVTEAFAWLVTGLGSGVAAGAAVAGQVLDAEGTTAALAFAPAWALAAAAALALGGRTLIVERRGPVRAPRSPHPDGRALKTVRTPPSLRPHRRPLRASAPRGRFALIVER